MLLLIQRCLSAAVDVGGENITRIGKGLTVFCGIDISDTEQDAVKAADKAVGMRIFENPDGKLDLSVSDVGGEILLVSNFTLCGDASHGRRPDFISAQRPERAKALYELLAAEMRKTVRVGTGVFGADMKVNVENDGPVNILYNTKKRDL